MSTEENDELEELRRKREERRRQAAEEEKKEEEERAKREEERKQRKLERERKSKEREEQHAKELEDARAKTDKETERRKRREEREKQKLEEERLEKEAEEKRVKEREEKKRQEQEAAEEEERKKKKNEADALRKSQEGDLPARDKREEVRPDARRRSKNEKFMDIIKSGKPDAVDKIVIDDDMKEEATKLLTEENELVVEFFGKSETILTILKYISTVQVDPHKLSDDELEDVMGRMEFAKDAICGTIPALWRTLLQPENRAYLAELFALLKNDNPILPPINVSCFWKSLEFLLYRRSYEITNYIITSKEVIPSFFKHLRDTNLMDVFIKLVDKETTASPLFKEYDPKKAAELPPEDTRFWTDEIPANILEKVAQGGAGADTEWSDVEIENIAQFSSLVLEKYSTCKLAHQLRDMTFCSALISRMFDPFVETQNGVATNGTHGAHGKAKYRHQSTVVAILSYLTQLLKFYSNSSAYATDTIPPLVACLIYGSGGRGSRAKVIPVNIIKNWLANKVPEFEFPIEHLGRKPPHKIGAMRVKCIQLVRALFLTNFQSVDLVLRDNGTLQTCVDLFFHNMDNNIVHTIIEEIIKLFLVRETSSPIIDLDSSAHPVTPFTQFLLDDCNLVERLVATLRTIAVNKNEFTHFSPTKLDLDDDIIASAKKGDAAPEKEKVDATTARGRRRGDSIKMTDKDKREKPFLPPAFVGHVLDICKAITTASEKSVKVRHLVASCSGYHWGQTVMFHLGMRDTADMEWKKPFKKPVPLDNPPTAIKAE